MAREKPNQALMTLSDDDRVLATKYESEGVGSESKVSLSTADQPVQPTNTCNGGGCVCVYGVFFFL